MATRYSFELFPSRSAAAAARLETTLQRLTDVGPDFYSVTYGADGSSRDATLELVRRILAETPVPVLAHLTCVGSSAAQTAVVIREFLDAGVRRFLALRGDQPKQAPAGAPAGDLASASELVQLIHRVQEERQAFEQVPLPLPGRTALRSARSPLQVAVAAFPSGHPRNTPGFDDVDALLAKQVAGADLAVTQLFFDADEFLGFEERARRGGVTIPILPGILPVLSGDRLRKAAQLSDQVVPRGLEAALDGADDDEARYRLGVEHAAGLIRSVVAGGAPGVHLYTFNQHRAPIDVLEAADLLDPACRAQAFDDRYDHPVTATPRKELP